MITGGSMKRMMIPLALAALVAGCSLPGMFGQQAEQPVVADSAQTVVVREIYHETPVYYVDTVYMAEQPAPAQPVYVEEHNDYTYNEYNRTNVYVREQVVVQPSREPGWSPRDRGRKPDDRRDNGSRRDGNQPREERPRKVNPQYPVKRVDAPAVNDRQQAPPPPNKPVPPARQAPARVGSGQVTQVQNEAARPASDSVRVNVPTNQAVLAAASERVAGTSTGKVQTVSRAGR
jgi:hypothetical protein